MRLDIIKANSSWGVSADLFDCPSWILSVSDAEAPGYSAVVTSPMDLSTMTRKARTGEYKSFDEFEVGSSCVSTGIRLD